MASRYLVAVFLSLVLFVGIRLFKRWKPMSLPFPPGPKPGFITGNLRDIPTELPWLTYTEWGKQYGTSRYFVTIWSLLYLSGHIVHAQVFGEHILIVNSAKTAAELLDKRASIYSERPHIPMVPLMGWDFAFSLMPHTNKWRQYRRLFHQHFRRDAIVTYRPIQLRKIHDMLRGLLSTPEDFFAHTKTVAAAIIMATVYGYDIKPTHDRFVDLAEDAVKMLGDSVLPGAFLVNTFPFLRHLPSWFPGCGFQRYAQNTFQKLAEMQNAPFDFVRQNMRDDVVGLSVLGQLLEKNDAQGGSKAQEKVLKEVTAMAYSAAADTTASALTTFFLAMAINPEVQRKAQNEIDTVIGLSRLPGFEDRRSLPYVEALLREVLRWMPVLPLGVAHATSEDDIYEGYFIPKGTMVLSNIWAMVHDEAVYPDPEKFQPERFLNANGQLDADDNILAFGFGRRACVGRHAADATLWATIVSVLSVFDISKVKDAAGNTVEIHPVYSDGLISHPHPFECSITPRSDVARRLVEDTSLDA
ncbi:cytochrome P450 [Mycena vulgaris]|nr:cytochrome P450 [Mycena vulgaris]